MAKLFDRAEKEAKWRSLEKEMDKLTAKVDKAIKTAKLIDWKQFSDAVATIEAGVKDMKGAIGER